MSRTVLSLVLVTLVSACGSISSQTPTISKTSLGQATVDGLSAELFTDNQLQTGLSPLYLKISDGGTLVITDATLTVTPQMTMSGGMQHGAPVLGDPSVDSSGLYHVNVVFQMASSATDIWAVSVGHCARRSRCGPCPVQRADRGRQWTRQWSSRTRPQVARQSNYVAASISLAQPRWGSIRLCSRFTKLRT